MRTLLRRFNHADFHLPPILFAIHEDISNNMLPCSSRGPEPVNPLFHTDLRSSVDCDCAREMTIQSFRRKIMKKTIGLTFTLLLTVAFALTQTSLASQEEMKKKTELKSYSPNDIFNAASQEEMKKKADKPAKAAAAPKAPKTDADVQKCIADKFAASKTVTNGAAAVANGAATLTGEAKNAGAKGGATRTAKGCGAKTVVNNMTTPAPPPAAAKTGEKKK